MIAVTFTRCLQSCNVWMYVFTSIHEQLKKVDWEKRFAQTLSYSMFSYVIIVTLVLFTVAFVAPLQHSIAAARASSNRKKKPTTIITRKILTFGMKFLTTKFLNGFVCM